MFSTSVQQTECDQGAESLAGGTLAWESPVGAPAPSVCVPNQDGGDGDRASRLPLDRWDWSDCRVPAKPRGDRIRLEQHGHGSSSAGLAWQPSRTTLIPLRGDEADH